MIHFFSEQITFRLSGKQKIRKWLKEVLKTEKFREGTINFIFCSDDYLLGMNKAYLNHDTFTDILTFPGEVETAKISGDIYISIPRVIENSETFHQSFDRELSRVMVHGILHLAGYKDKTKVQKLEMMAKEEQYLLLYQ